MDATNTAPIYDLLITERGNVIADAAHAAEQTRLKAADTLDFRLADTAKDHTA
ncbi:hypothetical protein ABZV81_25740 [Streptomyces parvus]|uniref:Uncharacterized protein n=1 Tax=Streptomyces sp. JL1001 TaxID=3078227 RepID=A0AAU8KSK4_9ACTN|nr:hypothetical protein [Streptomyces sp. Termitarium-T10T-6]SCD89565.1 hypothetical protein GA0115253_102282 [Streptomyces sp. Termitarium-T10T-6]